MADIGRPIDTMVDNARRGTCVAAPGKRLPWGSVAMGGPWRVASEPLSTGPGDRRYVDARGMVGCVRERDLPGGSPALYFETTTAFRRVTDYPADWRDLPTSELEILSLRS